MAHLDSKQTKRTAKAWRVSGCVEFLKGTDTPAAPAGRRGKDLPADASVLTVRQEVSDLAHPVLNVPLYRTRVSRKLSPVPGPGEVHLTKKPRAEALGVIVYSYLKIDS